MHEMTHTEVGGKLKDEIGENKTKEVFVWPQGHMKTMLY